MRRKALVRALRTFSREGREKGLPGLIEPKAGVYLEDQVKLISFLSVLFLGQPLIPAEAKSIKQFPLICWTWDVENVGPEDLETKASPLKTICFGKRNKLTTSLASGRDKDTGRFFEAFEDEAYYAVKNDVVVMKSKNPYESWPTGSDELRHKTMRCQFQISMEAREMLLRNCPIAGIWRTNTYHLEHMVK